MSLPHPLFILAIPRTLQRPCSYRRSATYRVYIFILIILCISIVLDVIEIVTYARHTLQPLTYLIFQVVKTVIWLAEFILALTNTIKVENDLAQITVDAPLHMLFNGLLEATVLLYV